MHIRKIGTSLTFCGENVGDPVNGYYDNIDWSYSEEDSTCSVCSVQYLEGEIEYVKRLSRDKEDRIISWVMATLIGGSFLIVVLFCCLAIFG